MNINSEQIWYTKNLKSSFLLPLSWLFRSIVAVRRHIYTRKSSRRNLEDVFIIVVGNITVGGAGKTPFVESLAKRLLQQGKSVGIISRGYKRTNRDLVEVMLDSEVQEVGDEALMLKHSVNCPVAVAADRRSAACFLYEKYQLDIIISDDGLQHHNLPRDYEIVIVDGEREFGNGRLLPAGPLREPISRLQSTDLVISNGKNVSYDFQYVSQFSNAVSLDKKEVRTIESFKGQSVHAVAGIGNPKRFFAMLEANGIEVMEHAFTDHHHFQQEDVDFMDDMPVLMTEKDAIKCKKFTLQSLWYVPIEIEFNDKLEQKISSVLEDIN